jgi:hypothetical protein
MRLVSPLLSLDYRRTATVGSYWRGMGEAHNFNYSMNSLRSNSISYLVAQPKVETRYNKKTCMLFSLFVRNADMPAGLSFLLIFYESSILNPQISKIKVHSCES